MRRPDARRRRRGVRATTRAYDRASAIAREDANLGGMCAGGAPASVCAPPVGVTLDGRGVGEPQPPPPLRRRQVGVKFSAPDGVVQVTSGLALRPHHFEQPQSRRMGRSRSRSRDRRGRSRSRSRDRDRDRERRRERSRSRDRRHRDNHRRGSRDAPRDARDGSRERDGRKRGRDDDRGEFRGGVGRGGRSDGREEDDDDGRRAGSSDKNAEDAEAEKKRARLAAAKALMDKKRAAAAKEAAERVAARATAEHAAASAPAPPARPGGDDDDDVDPLDAFMAAEINPEVRRREEEEAKAKRDAMLRRANEIKAARESGKEVRARADATMLADIDAEIEEKPDETVEIPDNKVKLVIGAGGENIRRIQKKSNCRLQVKKKAAAMSVGFGGTDEAGLMRDDDDDDDEENDGKNESGSTTFMLFGSPEAREAAKRMIHELFDKAAEAKARQRQDEKDYKAKKRERARLEYHLRHKKDYDVLGVQLGASKDECKRAYRKLAVRWHPDKHPEGDARVEAEAKFKEIQRAFDALMTTDENQTIEALAAKGQREAERAVKELKKEAAKRDGVDMEAVARSVAEVQERAKRAAAEAKAREIEAAREAYRRM